MISVGKKKKTGFQKNQLRATDELVRADDNEPYGQLLANYCARNLRKLGTAPVDFFELSWAEIPESIPLEIVQHW